MSTKTALPATEGRYRFVEHGYIWVFDCSRCHQRNQRIGGKYGEDPDHMLGEIVECRYDGTEMILTEAPPRPTTHKKAQIDHGPRGPKSLRQLTSVP